VKFSIGQRVKHRIRGEFGHVVGSTAHAPLRYKVAFATGTWDVPPSDLLPVYDDPFEILITGGVEVCPYDACLRREGLRLLDAYRNDPTAALSNSRIEPQPHQVGVAMRALAKPQPRLILADEVGLGKTIEAGLILKELRARGVLNRVLILSPSSLVTQWQQELRSKFNEIFMNHDGFMLRELRERHPDANPWGVGERANIITSMQFARLDGQRQEIAEADWDLVIVDEAHHARRRESEGGNLSYRLLEELRDRVGGLLLLTATPMQLETYELYSMVELVEPGLFDDYWSFERARHDIARINAQVAWLRLSAPTNAQREDIEELYGEWSAPELVRAADLTTTDGRRVATSWLESKHLLSEAMVRNRKAEVGQFMRRIAHRLPVQPTDEELELERDVQAYLRREYARSPAFGLVLVTFQKLLASSSRALAQALERRAMRILREETDGDAAELTDDPELLDELDELLSADRARAGEAAELAGLAQRARAIVDTKLDVLALELEALFDEQPDQKVLIFTQYLGTLDMIRERLAPKLRVNVFHGGMDRREKDLAHHAFKAHGQVLISTEAGGEGRNFQFCHILFNYDLPWNPMRIEQRIGRLDRVGQKHNVLIYNFGVRDTLDERVLDVLEHRIRIFTESVGALEPILGDIEERIKAICLKDARTAQREFDRYEVDLDERIRRARTQDDQMRDFVMDTQSFRRDEVRDLLDETPMATMEDLKRFVLAVLRRYPTGSSARVVAEGPGVLRITPPGVIVRSNDRILDGSDFVGTFDYRVALEDESLDFFAFGHPLVDALVAAVSEDGSVPPVGISHSPDLDAGAIVDYEIRFTGVRDRQELISHRVRWEAVDAAPTLDLESQSRELEQLPALLDEEIMALVETSTAAVDDEIERRFSLFTVDNEFNFEAERNRLEKLFAFQRRHYEIRIQRTEAQIARLLEYGTESERRVLPALRGRIQTDKGRIAEIDELHIAQIDELEKRREPSRQSRPVGVILLKVGARGDGRQMEGASLGR
jgi:ERCC4-related helicase